MCSGNRSIADPLVKADDETDGMGSSELIVNVN